MQSLSGSVPAPPPPGPAVSGSYSAPPSVKPAVKAAPKPLTIQPSMSLNSVDVQPSAAPVDNFATVKGK
jgi:hypothetical protein